MYKLISINISNLRSCQKQHKIASRYWFYLLLGLNLVVKE